MSQSKKVYNPLLAMTDEKYNRLILQENMKKRVPGDRVPPLPDIRSMTPAQYYQLDPELKKKIFAANLKAAMQPTTIEDETT